MGRHPMRIYSHWDKGRGIGQGEGETVNRIITLIDTGELKGENI